jgi:hypothetical protein
MYNICVFFAHLRESRASNTRPRLRSIVAIFYTHGKDFVFVLRYVYVFTQWQWWIGLASGAFTNVASEVHRQTFFNLAY